MADNYLERKFEEYNNPSNVSRRKPQKKIKARRALIVGLHSDMANVIEHSLRMIGHSVLVADSLPSNDDKFEIVISSPSFACDCVRFVLNNSAATNYGRMVVVGQIDDLRELSAKFANANFTINMIEYSESTDLQNIARTCRIFVADENGFLNGNTLSV